MTPHIPGFRNFRALQLFTALLVLLQIILPLSSYSVCAVGEEQDDVSRRRQQRQQQQRERYLNRHYWDLREGDEEDDLGNLWDDIEEGKIGTTASSKQNGERGRPRKYRTKEEPVHPWDAEEDEEIGSGFGDVDEDEFAFDDKDEYAFDDEEEENENDEEAGLKNQSIDTNVVAAAEGIDSVASDSVGGVDTEENEEKEDQFTPSRVVLADVRTILEVNIRKAQDGFLPQKVLVMLNEMVKDDVSEMDGGGAGTERIFRQHLCWALFNKEGDIWPYNEYPCYEWYKRRPGSLYSGFDKSFDSAMRFIERVESGQGFVKETYTMRLDRYRAIGHMNVYIKRPGGVLKKDWSNPMPIVKLVNCKAKKHVECFTPPGFEGKDVVWRIRT